MLTSQMLISLLILVFPFCFSLPTCVPDRSVSIQCTHREFWNHVLLSPRKCPFTQLFLDYNSHSYLCSVGWLTLISSNFSFSPLRCSLPTPSNELLQHFFPRKPVPDFWVVGPALVLSLGLNSSSSEKWLDDSTWTNPMSHHTLGFSTAMSLPHVLLFVYFWYLQWNVNSLTR